MRVKRFEGKNEEAILEQIKEEMGDRATIVSTRSKPYPPPMGWFRRPRLVVTAAYDDDEAFLAEDDENDDKKVKAPFVAPQIPDILKAAQQTAPPKDEDSIEESLALLLQEARKATLKTEAAEEPAPVSKMKPQAKKQPPQDYKNPLVQTIYDTLISQDVLPQVAHQLLEDVALAPANEKDIKNIIATVYAKIVALLSNPTLVDAEKPTAQTIVFMGPTGVGKTTTIAKLASVLSLQHDKHVGLVTADTYRIAAVEQLRTYADILGLEIRTVYNADEMVDAVAELIPPHDLVLIDTAGRSHKNKENLDELAAVLAAIPDATRYLVLSVATRYKDMANIVNTYAAITDFNIIFTKVDESDTLGNLVNICCLTGKKPAYITFGQSVPEDFDAVKPDNVAKSLLALGGDTP